MKKSLLFISALCLGASSGFAQLDSIPNANFDSWTSGEPNNWGTSNGLNIAVAGGAAQATGADMLGPNTLLLTSKAAFGQVVPGMAIASGTITPNGFSAPTFSGGFKFREHATAFTGVSKYVAGGAGDAPIVGVVLTRWIATPAPGHRDTIAFATSSPTNTAYARFTIPFTYKETAAIAPDSAHILVLSSGQTGAVAGSQFFVDSLAFGYGCMLDPTINSTAAAQDQKPAAGDTVTVMQGADYSRTWTIYVPPGVTSPITVTLDSIKITNAEVTSTPTIAGATYTVSTNWGGQGYIGSGTIACVTVAGHIPANAGNQIVEVSLAPILYGGAPLGSGGLQSPQATKSYLRIGTGNPADGIDVTIDSTGFSLSQNSPNPFDGTTTINFTCPTSGKVGFVVVDVLGRQVYNTNINATVGSNSFTYTSDLAAGTYFFSITDGTNTITNKMVISGK